MKLPKHLAAALVAAALLPIHAKAALAWRVVDSVVDRRPEMAAVCQFWNATVFAPGESESCPIGMLFFVDLSSRSLHYADRGPRGLGQSERDRKQVVEVMYRNLSESGALEKLEAYRASQENRKEQEADKTQTQKEREYYLQDFAAAKGYLELIQDFERKYAGRDPLGLIPQLAPEKARLEHRDYTRALAEAESSELLASAISKYQTNDPEGLVPPALKRLADLQKQELAERTRKLDEMARKAAAEEKTASAARAQAEELRRQLTPRCERTIASGDIAGEFSNFRNPIEMLESLKHASFVERRQVFGEGMVFRNARPFPYCAGYAQVQKLSVQLLPLNAGMLKVYGPALKQYFYGVADIPLDRGGTGTCTIFVARANTTCR
jgi:hypothetical protein